MTKAKQTIPWWSRFLKQFYLMRTKLIVSFLAVLLIPSVLIGYFSYQGAKTQLSQQMGSSIDFNLFLFRSNINQYVSPLIKDLNVLATEVQSNTLNSKNEEIQAKFDVILKAHPELDGVLLGNTKGEYVRSPKKESTDYDPREKKWYSNAIGLNGETIISAPSVSASSGNLVVTLSRSLPDGQGAIAMNLSLDRLSESLKEVTIGNRGGLFVVDANSTVVAGAGVAFKNTGKKPADSIKGLPVITKLNEGEIQSSSATKEIRLMNRDMQSFTLVDPLTGWNVIALADQEDYSDSVAPILRQSLIVIAISTLVAAIIIILMIRSFLIPLGKLQNGTREVRDGNLTARVNLSGKDEFSELAQNLTR
ncbi:cache domain-containing protein [Paenibacillus terrae]|uniref:cache domain-containing protein n=1 Tax=Paenibacillus terrae TaxID=159743 RepID=UPI0021CC9BAB|nr:cache domain-containing protein [Paenibacillus terrae]